MGESRKLIDQKQDLFCNEGEVALPEIQKINTRLFELLKESETDFPLSNAEAVEFRASLYDILLKISAVEQKAVELLQNAIM